MINIFKKTLPQKLDKHLKKHPNLQWLYPKYLANKLKCSVEEMEEEVIKRGYDKAYIFELPCGGILEIAPIKEGDYIPEELYDYFSAATYRLSDLKRVTVYLD